MVIEKLYDKVLMEPVKQKCNNLYIVSGYASAAMAFHHLNETINKYPKLKINLIVGMTPVEGISISNHRGFQKLQNEYLNNFSCSYIYKNLPVHSKTYGWYINNNPIVGYSGSANYTQMAFLKGQQREVLNECSPIDCYNYYQSVLSDSIFCNHIEADQFITIFNDKNYARKLTRGTIEQIEDDTDIKSTLDQVSLSFLDDKGEVPKRSGLNWGQRPGRNPNQAYINIPATIYKTDFFPPIATHFTVLTDDNKTLICTRAQDNGKAIETPHNNSLIGEYLRNRLGLANGQFIRKDDLFNYGRTDITFYKIDDETYLADFSV